MILRILLLVVAVAPAASWAQSVVDSSLKVQPVVSGLSQPTGVAFFNNGSSAFIIQKADGQVKLMQNGQVTGTALDLSVANDSERGLLGIALHPNFATNHKVYLYYTASDSDGGNAIANRIDRFKFDGSQLVFNRRILDLPATPGPNHDGGKIVFGPDGKLYSVTGDLNREQRAQNFASTPLRPSGTIQRLNPNGTAPADNPFFDPSKGNRAINRTYAYGVRNSFGLAFDPVTGDLWDSEAGPTVFDEINLAFPGFNSGWKSIMGPTSRNGGSTGSLVSLGAKARYADPRFSWATPVTPTAMHFVPTSILGSQYTNDLFVGDNNTGTLFHFTLNSARRAFVLSDALADRVADNSGGDLLAEQTAITFGSGFGVVTDITSTADGMYVLSLDQGTLYRISPATAAQFRIVPEPTVLMPVIVFGGFLCRRRSAH